ncbi:hypothetical protein MW887_007437 [Aspergillus wentii]|nr:hypothetical protein MW887_007437 [Aspergillus wentii]
MNLSILLAALALSLASAAPIPQGGLDPLALADALVPHSGVPHAVTSLGEHLNTRSS